MSNTDNNIQGEKARLESKDYIRLILQGLAIVGGLWGLFKIYHGILFIVSAYTDKSNYPIHVIHVTSLIFFAVGVYFLMVAYLMVRKFSVRSLKHFSAVVAFTFYGLVFFRYIYPPIGEMAREGKSEPWHIVIPLLLLLCLVVVYRICTKLLVRLTKAGAEQKQ